MRGCPLVQSLEILASQQDNKIFKGILREIREDVEGGSTFAGALKKHPNVFNDLYTNLVVAGEEGGILDNILNRLAAYIEKAEALKKKVKSALVYPSVIVTVAIGVVIDPDDFCDPSLRDDVFIGGAKPSPSDPDRGGDQQIREEIYLYCRPCHHFGHFPASEISSH